MKQIAFAAMFGALLVSGCATSQASAQMSSGSEAELLSAQNAYRTELGLPPLQWSDALAARAQGWADHLAAIGQLVHSGPGENLAWGTAGSFAQAQLVALWGSEQTRFRDGVFPAVSTTGNWMDVGHYSQMVWRTTTAVGCGFAESGGHDILVCNYDPPGNIMGEPVY